jgi:hypothetical protein
MPLVKVTSASTKDESFHLPRDYARHSPCHRTVKYRLTRQIRIRHADQRQTGRRATMWRRLLVLVGVLTVALVGLFIASPQAPRRHSRHEQ